MLPYYVGKGGLWLSHLAISEIRNLQVRFHPHAFRSSLARTWCCFPQCWVVTWNVVLKCLCTWVVGVTQWRVLFCLLQHVQQTKGSFASSTEEGRQKQPLHQSFRLLGKQPTTDKKSWYNGITARRCFAQCWVVTWNMVPKCLCTWVVGVTNEVLCFACSNIKRKEISRRSVQSTEEGWQKQSTASEIAGCSASNQRLTKKAGNGMLLFLSVLVCDMIARLAWSVDDKLKSGDEKSVWRFLNDSASAELW